MAKTCRYFWRENSGSLARGPRKSKKSKNFKNFFCSKMSKNKFAKTQNPIGAKKNFFPARGVSGFFLPQKTFWLGFGRNSQGRYLAWVVCDICQEFSIAQAVAEKLPKKWPKWPIHHYITPIKVRFVYGTCYMLEIILHGLISPTYDRKEREWVCLEKSRCLARGPKYPKIQKKIFSQKQSRTTLHARIMCLK